MIGYLSTHTVLGLQHFLLREGNTLLVGVTNDADDALIELTDNSGWNALYPGQCEIALRPEDYASCVFVFADGPLDPDFRAQFVALDIPLVAPHPQIVAWEENRGLAKTLAQHCGLQVAPASQNHSRETLANAVAGYAADQLLVLKGDLNSVIMPAADAVDFASNLAALDSITVSPASEIHLEQFVKGFEVAYGFWFNGSEYLSTTMLTHEYKAACEGGRGWILTGEVGTYFEFVELDMLPEAIQQVAAYLQPLLAAVDYRGFVDLNTLHTNVHGVESWTFLEFTVRPGFPTELEMAGWLRQCGLQYGDLLRWCAGLNRDFEVPIGSGLAGALFTQGLGLSTVSLPFQPRLHSNHRLPAQAELLPFDACWDATANTWRMFDWDRFVFVAVYTEDLPNAERDFNHKADLLRGTLAQLTAWGHTHRTDLGTDLTQALHLYNGALSKQPTTRGGVVETWLHQATDSDLLQLSYCDTLYFPDELSWDLNEWREIAANPNTSIAYWTDGTSSAWQSLKGYAVWTMRDGVAWLENMLVLPHYRRQRLAATMVCNYWLKHGPREMRCEAHTDAATALYLSVGFREESRSGDTRQLVWKPDHA